VDLDEKEGLLMTEHIAHMGPMLILAGLLAGWLAEALSRDGGYGYMLDMAVGLVGSVVAGTLVWIFFSGIGMPLMFGSGCAGATLAIAAQRGLWRSVRLGT
jgi:uncharacterized membrane protein YeaQ/YmgE (transglycosylase-associated protein family)